MRLPFIPLSWDFCPENWYLRRHPMSAMWHEWIGFISNTLTRAGTNWESYWMLSPLGGEWNGEKWDEGRNKNVRGDRDSKAARAKQRSFFACQKRFKHMLIRKGCTVQIVSTKPGYVRMGRNKCLTRCFPWNYDLENDLTLMRTLVRYAVKSSKLPHRISDKK